jgi:pimeloyl-ACP methyl ester carboxylesterase
MEAMVNPIPVHYATLLVLVDDVIGQERFLVVGHCCGGYLARAIANRRPGQVAGLALICSLAGEQGGGDERPEHVILHAAGDLDLDGAPEPAMAAEFRNGLVVQTPETLRRFQETVAPGVALTDQAGHCCVGGGRASEQPDYWYETSSPPSRSRYTVGLRGLPLPTRRHRPRDPLVPALRAVVPRR